MNEGAFEAQLTRFDRMFRDTQKPANVCLYFAARCLPISRPTSIYFLTP